MGIGVSFWWPDVLLHTNQLQIRGEMLENLLTSSAVAEFLASVALNIKDFFKQPNAPVCVGFGRGIVMTFVTERFAFSSIAMKFFFSSALFRSWMIWWPNTGGDGGRRRASAEFEIVHRILIFYINITGNWHFGKLPALISHIFNDGEVLKQDCEVLKQDGEVLKQDCEVWNKMVKFWNKIVRFWNKMVKFWNKMVDFWNKMVDFWNKMVEFWNKIVNFWNKIMKFWNKTVSFETRRWVLKWDGEFWNTMVSFETRRWVLKWDGEFWNTMVSFETRRWVLKQDGEFWNEITRVAETRWRSLTCKWWSFETRRRVETKFTHHQRGP